MGGGGNVGDIWGSGLHVGKLAMLGEQGEVSKNGSYWRFIIHNASDVKYKSDVPMTDEENASVMFVITMSECDYELYCTDKGSDEQGE